VHQTREGERKNHELREGRKRKGKEMRKLGRQQGILASALVHHAQEATTTLRGEKTEKKKKRGGKRLTKNKKRNEKKKEGNTKEHQRIQSMHERNKGSTTKCLNKEGRDCEKHTWPNRKGVPETHRQCPEAYVLTPSCFNLHLIKVKP